MTDLERQARNLADRPYTSIVFTDETTDGEPYWSAITVELPGCVGSGTTSDEAWADLREVRREYILSLLDDGLPVPEPSCYRE
jgi:predicted RNase H-like HicB family nuclease